MGVDHHYGKVVRNVEATGDGTTITLDGNVKIHTTEEIENLPDILGYSFIRAVHSGRATRLHFARGWDEVRGEYKMNAEVKYNQPNSLEVHDPDKLDIANHLTDLPSSESDDPWAEDRRESARVSAQEPLQDAGHKDSMEVQSKNTGRPESEQIENAREEEG